MKAATENFILGALVSCGVAWILIFNLAGISTHQHFAWLAESFWRGRLDIPAERILADSPIDISYRDGRYYWPLEPLPAVLMMPLVPWFGADAQLLLQITVALSLALLAYRLARLTGFTAPDAVWLSFLFCFGSVAIGVISLNAPWYVGNTVAALCLLAALVEQRSRDRTVVIGFFAGLAWISRLTAGLGTVYFFVCELLRPGSWRSKAGRLVRLAVPVAGGIALAALYNHLRFGSPFDTGHAGHYLRPDGPEARRLAEYGLFSLAHAGRNFYFYFLKLPELYRYLPAVSPYGVSIFLLAPVFILAGRSRVRHRVEFIAVAVATAGTLAVFLSYFTTGFWQFGPRYLMDILPYWFLLLLLALRSDGFGTRHKMMIAASAGLNMTLFVLFALRNIFKIF